MSTQAAAAKESIECPLCLGAGSLSRAGILDRLGVKDFARVAQLSAEEAFRLLQGQYRQDGEALWTRFENELGRRLGDLEQQHGAKVHELEAQLQVAQERTKVDSQRVRDEFEARVRSERAENGDFRRRIEEYLSELSRIRYRNQELEAEMSKVARRGKRQELGFEDDVRTWPGVCVSAKLGRNGDYLLAYRDPAGAALEPRLLVDCKDKTAITETDLKKLIRDAHERHAPVGIIVAQDETQLRQIDCDCRWAQEDGVWVLRTTRGWLRRDLDVLCPLLERMRTEGADFLRQNAALSDEVRRSLCDLDEVEKEMKKAAKAIDAATGLTTKYRVRLQTLCDHRLQKEKPMSPSVSCCSLETEGVDEKGILSKPLHQAGGQNEQ